MLLAALARWGVLGEAAPASLPQTSLDDHAAARAVMVDQQIAGRGVTDQRVLAAMRSVPRHRFLPRELASSAYDDTALPIGFGQTISQPYIVAYMTTALELRPGHRVLEIGTGSGYQAAVLATIAKEVFTIEIVPELADRARQILHELGCENVHVRTGDGYAGWAEHAPFDRIIVTAAPDHVPSPLVDQLVIDGRMIVPVGDLYQRLMVVRKTTLGVVSEPTLYVRFVPLTRRPRP
jgi:protein-L-isoaspartate(D-aspartate) O-methyltransferase